MLEMNINDVLKKLNAKDVEVSHSDLTGVSNDMADYIVCSKDLAMAMNHLENVIELDSILDKKELEEKLSKILVS